MSNRKLVVVNINNKNYRERCFDIKEQLEAMHIDTSNFLFLPSDVKFSQVDVLSLEDNNE